MVGASISTNFLTDWHLLGVSYPETSIDLFSDTAAILNLLDLRSMPREHSLSIYAGFSGIKRTSTYTSREKGDHYYIQARHNDLFFSLQSFSRKTSRKIGPKSARKY